MNLSIRVVWITATAITAAALVALTLVVKANPASELDRELVKEIGSWGAVSLGGWYDFMSEYSGQWPAVMSMFGAVLATMMIGRMNNAVALAVTLALVGGADLAVGYGLGTFAEVERPTGGARSFPSGHVAYITSACIMLGYVAWVRRFHPILMALLVPIFLFLMYSSGVSRIYQEAHWPSDVLGGYILGILGPLVFIPFYRSMERVRWITPPRVGIDVPGSNDSDAVIAGSYGSAVVIEPSRGVATKWFDPPVMLRALYWVSFQQQFPYVRETAAIEAAVHRRKIAGYITQYRFGENLVSQIVDVRWHEGRAGLVTEYVAGVEPENNTKAWGFLDAVEVLFEVAGLPGWQLNPHNPHAHTNLVQREDGNFIIIDMESGFVTPFPSRNMLRSSLKHGTLPVFDDIDFDRLKSFMEEREKDLRESLGETGFADLQASASACEAAYRGWHGKEPRVWGRAVRWTYRALNIRADFAAARKGVAGAGQRAASFMDGGVTRWEKEGRISAVDADLFRRSLNDPEMAVALEHLGAHMMISVVFRFPFGSLLRVLWVLAFMFRASTAMVARRTNNAGGITVHNPFVLLWAGLPGLGSIAYIFSKPLLKPFLIRLTLDQTLHGLPLQLYTRCRFDRWLPPPVKNI